jgi:smad nuclear-interacting protein 1
MEERPRYRDRRGDDRKRSRSRSNSSADKVRKYRGEHSKHQGAQRERRRRSQSRSSADERKGRYRDQVDRTKNTRGPASLSEEDYRRRNRRETSGLDPTRRTDGERRSHDRTYKDSRSRSPKGSYIKRRRRSPSLGDRKLVRDRDEEFSNRTRRRRSSPPQSPPRTSRRSPPPKAIEPYKRSRGPLPSQEAAFTGGPKSTESAISKTGSPQVGPPVEKQKPNFAPSGALAAETNTVAGTNIVLKYNEPPESRKPPASQAWRLFVFKGSDTIDTLELGHRSCWLFGRARTVVDYPVDHPSCSMQHAVLQFRYVEKKNEFGDKEGGVRPYIIDLESTNGTKVNGEKIPERRYVELISGDVLGFGDSTREYVILLPPKD